MTGRESLWHAGANLVPCLIRLSRGRWSLTMTNTMVSVNCNLKDQEISSLLLCLAQKFHLLQTESHPILYFWDAENWTLVYTTSLWSHTWVLLSPCSNRLTKTQSLAALITIKKFSRHSLAIVNPFKMLSVFVQAEKITVSVIAVVVPRFMCEFPNLTMSAVRNKSNLHINNRVLYIQNIPANLSIQTKNSQVVEVDCVDCFKA